MSAIHGIEALLISDDSAVAGTFRRLAGAVGVDLSVASGGAEVARRISERRPDVVFAQLDNLSLLPADGDADAEWVPRTPPTAAFSRESSISQAVKAIRAGAVKYLSELPDGAQGFRRIVAGLLRFRTGGEEPGLSCLQCSPFDGYLTSDPRLLSICRTLRMVANSDAAVLLEGETGTGKNLLARKVHQYSFRCLAPFVKVVPGAEKAPGSGVGEEVPARMRDMDTGSVYVDLTNDPSTQHVQDVLASIAEKTGGAGGRGGSEPRVVLGVAHSPGEEYLRMLYQAGLGGSIDPVRVTLPPLRDRAGDIALLARAFLWRQRARGLSRVTRMGETAFRALIRHRWPRNVDGLKAALRSGALRASAGRVLRCSHLPDRIKNSDGAEGKDGGLNGRSLAEALRKPEKKLIERALRQMRGNKRAAARKLGISRSTLYKKLKKHGLDNGHPGAGLRGQARSAWVTAVDMRGGAEWAG